MRARHCALGALVAMLLFSAQAGAAAPDPGGDENAILSGPPPSKSFGFNDSFSPGGLTATQVAATTRSAGGNAIRLSMRWQGLEPLRDVYSDVTFARYTLAYTEYLAAGITPHLLITHAPPWARDPAYQSCSDKDWCIFPPAPAMLGEWAEFMRELARRYPRAVIEIWNEPNFIGSWRSGVDPERYAHLLATAYDAVKGVSPSTQVLAGGLGSSVKPDSLTVREFLDRAYAATPSIKGHMDALNLHIYPGPKLGANSFLAHTMQDVRAARANAGDTARIFVTETGATTTGPDGVSEDAQADIVMRATRKLLTMADVSGVLVSRLAEDLSAPADDNERGLGINRVLPLGGLHPKLAFCALTRAAGALDPLCPPETRIDSRPGPLINTSSATIGFSSPDALTSFQCSVDGAPFHDCSSPHTVGGLSDGKHRIEVRARDALLRVDPFPAFAEFEADTTPPDTAIDGPSGPGREQDPRYVLSSEAGARFECALDGGAFQPCATPYLPGTLSEGNHTVAARAVDKAENPDPSPATISITVDRTAPDTSLTTAPRRFEPDATPRVAFTGTEPGATFRCAVDSWDFQACSTPRDLGPLADGDHAFRVQAVDPAGNVDDTPAFSNFTVDTRSPAVAFTSTPPAFVKDTTPTIYFAADEPVSGVECRVDSAAFAPCAPPVTTAQLPEGAHSFEARARDRAENLSAIARTTFTVDVTSPEVSLTRSPARFERDTTPTVDFAANETGVTFHCAVDSWNFSSCTGPRDLGPLTDGDHAFRVRATDRAGNVEASAAYFNFTVDTVAPTIEIAGGPTGTITDTRPSFSFAVDDAGATVQCTLGASFGACSGLRSHQPSSPLPDGAYTLRARAADRAGNLSSVAGRSFSVRTTPLETLITSAPKKRTRERRPSFDFAANDPTAGFECSLDGASFRPCPSPHRLRKLKRGRHEMAVRAADAGGHRDSTPAVARFRIVR